MGGFVSFLPQSEEVLSKVVDALKVKVSEFNYLSWFGHARWSLEGEETLKVAIPNKFVRDWIVDHYAEIIKFEFFRITGRECSLQFVLNASLSQAGPTGRLPGDSKPVEPVSKKNPPARLVAGLNPRYTFENFVVGNSNQFVHAACRAVASNPAKNYNPFFIYGGVGLGKTHLINAIGIEVAKRNPGWKVVLVTGEQFTNEVINAIRYDKTYELRKKYRNDCDILLIDDIQFIAGKERTMEEFFHTFNTLYEARKQIILTSDTLPKDIPNLEERIRSRFGWGLLADIQIPDFETRSAILRGKAEAEKISLPDDVCQYIASHIRTNVRDLEGCLVRVSAFASLASVPITVPLASEVLQNIQNGFATVLTIEHIQKTVADYFKITMADLKSPRRHRNLAFPRQIAMFLCKKNLKASYPEIGHKFGGKDHTTVIHAFRKISTLLPSDAALKSNLDNLDKLLTQSAPHVSDH